MVDSPLENGPPFRVGTGVSVGSGGGSAYTISDNGDLAYIDGESQFTGGLRIVVAVNREGVERTLPIPSGYLQHPRLSPDGTTLLVSRGIAAELSLPSPDIWRVDLARGADTRLTLDAASLRPYWFPDGDRVACIRRYGQDSGLAFVRPVDGTDTPVRVGTRGVFVRGVSVSPRGDSLALVIGGGDASGGDDVWLAHVDSLHAPRPFHNAT